ncbi:MAG: hypothetical protein A2234_04430 [Elusimicrobia bacterium RIFOXYA2_FULL_58_8]|nr:MAG: hypothetical protein A2285_08220 [Elusimicrobia bacterium RIFOXYA12_FULL_57_11]OGS16991.1 MAG: hypothetical protein A2234_04430 [Elusimicrobia bacterium RIFOXYA2_FULL_58_8]
MKNMEIKTIRGLIYFFLVLIGVFFILMLVNLVGERASRKAWEAAARKDEGERVMLYGLPKAARLSAPKGFSSSSIRAEGAIMLVRDAKFDGVAEKPKNDMQALMGMGERAEKEATPVSLRDNEMFKKISSPAAVQPRLAGAAMPELGRNPGQDGVTLIAAPVDYKIFKSSAVWLAFASPRGITDIRHDFSGSDLLLLFSVSDLPNGIFKIRSVERGAKATVVKYCVDPLAMVVGVERGVRERYATISVPRKSPPVKLEQVP